MKNQTFKKQQLFKLVLALEDIERAANGLEVIGKTYNEIWAKLNGQNLTSEFEYIINALDSSVIIHYSKPFIGNKPFGTIGTNWKILKIKNNLKIHESVIDLRHTSEAHSDMNKRFVYLFADENSKYSPRFSIGQSAFDLSPLEDDLKIICKGLISEIKYKINFLTKEIYGKRPLALHPKNGVQIDWKNEIGFKEK